jgi:ribosomal protein L6P/L9E
MSHISKSIIKFPDNVLFEIKVLNENYDVIWISGEYGTYFCKIDKLKYLVKVEGFNKLTIKTTQFHSWLKSYYSCQYKSTIPGINSQLSLLWVTIRRMIIGAGVGFKKYLRVRGVGYSFQSENGLLCAKVGYTHTLKKTLPVEFYTKFSRKSKVVRFRSKSLSKLTLFLATLRVLRKPDIYKGKGIRYRRDPIRRKPGKRKTKAVSKKNKFNAKKQKLKRKFKKKNRKIIRKIKNVFIKT